MDASELFRTEASDTDEERRRQVRVLDTGVVRRRHADGPRGRRVVGNVPILPLEDDPSDLIHLTGAGARFVEDPSLDDCMIPVDEDLVEEIIDARG